MYTRKRADLNELKLLLVQVFINMYAGLCSPRKQNYGQEEEEALPQQRKLRIERFVLVKSLNLLKGKLTIYPTYLKIVNNLKHSGNTRVNLEYKIEF